jgi:hypothetical protein
MTPKALISAFVLTISLSANQTLAAKPDLTPEQLTKARASASQLNPPVNFDELMKEADKLDVECTGDLTRKARISICTDKVKNAKTQKNIDRLKAENARLNKENAKLIREVQQRIKENK